MSGTYLYFQISQHDTSKTVALTDIEALHSCYIRLRFRQTKAGRPIFMLNKFNREEKGEYCSRLGKSRGTERFGHKLEIYQLHQSLIHYFL